MRCQVSPFYDPMISKLIVRGPDRAAALRKLDLALSQYEVVGVPTNIGLIRRILATDGFQAGGVTTSFIEVGARGGAGRGRDHTRLGGCVRSSHGSVACRSTPPS